jgi:hypothetical protein
VNEESEPIHKLDSEMTGSNYKMEDGTVASYVESYTSDDGTRMYRLEQFNGKFSLPVVEVKKKVANGEWEPID